VLAHGRDGTLALEIEDDAELALVGGHTDARDTAVAQREARLARAPCERTLEIHHQARRPRELEVLDAVRLARERDDHAPSGIGRLDAHVAHGESLAGC